MNILVTGANGQLGRSIQAMAGNSTSNKYYFTDVGDLDITNSDDVNNFVSSCDIDLIINCAAYTNVDKAEEDYDRAELLNSTAVGYLAEAMKRNNGTLIHISTDYVFGAAQHNTPIKENVPPSPSGVYGLTKLLGEERIQKSGVKALIFRTSWLYSDYGNNFVSKMIDLLTNKRELKVVIDQAGTPTYASDLASAIIGIIESEKYAGNEGIYNFSNEGVCSWYDFSMAIKEYSKSSGCEILPCKSSEFPSKVVRPAYSVLDKSKVKETFGIRIPYWKNSLECMLGKQLSI